jgi:hypothetical protein
MVQPPEQRLVVEAKIGVPGTVANEAVRAAAQTVLNEDTTVKSAAITAVATEMATKQLVTSNDTRLPRESATEAGSVEYSRAWVDKAGRTALGITASGHTHAPVLDSELATVDVAHVAEHNVGGEQAAYAMDAEKYLYAKVDSAGRVSEHALDKNGRVPQEILDAWASRMGIGAVAGISSALPIVAWGDSQTGQVFDGQKGWVDEFARVLGLTQPDDVFNRGLSRRNVRGHRR